MLLYSGERVNNVETDLTQVQDTILELEKNIVEAGDQLTENSPTFTLISNTVGTKLQPKIETAAQVISTLRGTIVSANSTLETVNKMPFISVPTLPMEELSVIDQQMQDTVASVQTLAEAIKEKEAGVIERTAETLITPLGKLSALVEKVLTPIGTLNNTLQRVETAVADANESIRSLIDWWSVLITFVLFWLVLAQASLFYGGLYYWKTGTIPAIQISSSSNSSGG